MVKLTDKENKFCMAICDGYSQYDAYKIAFNPKTENRNSIDAMASKVAKKTEVQNRIKELRERRIDAKIYNDINDINKRYAIIWERIEACRKDGNDAAIAKYMDIINKMTGTYVEYKKDLSNDNPLKDVTTEQLQSILDMDIEHTTHSIQN